MENLLDVCRVLLVLISAHVASAGQCCNAYYDITFDYHDAKWCSSYCCGTSTTGGIFTASVGILECCDNFLLAASSEDTSVVCVDFFVQNIWVPILIGIGGLVGLGVVVAICFQHANRRGAVVQPSQPQTGYNPQHSQGPYGAQQYLPGANPPGNHAPGYPLGAAYPPPVYGAGVQSANLPQQSAGQPMVADEP